MPRELISEELLAKLEQAAKDLHAAREALEAAVKQGGLISPEPGGRRKHLRIVEPQHEIVGKGAGDAA